jgi:hypothetical protein
MAHQNKRMPPCLPWHRGKPFGANTPGCGPRAGATSGGTPHPAICLAWLLPALLLSRPFFGSDHVRTVCRSAYAARQLSTQPARHPHHLQSTECAVKPHHPLTSILSSSQQTRSDSTLAKTKPELSTLPQRSIAATATFKGGAECPQIQVHTVYCWGRPKRELLARNSLQASRLNCPKPPEGPARDSLGL